MSVFQGISDAQWQQLVPLIQQNKRIGRGRPSVGAREIINVLIWMSLNRVPWRLVPKGSIWASKSSAHSRWHVWSQDGTMARLQPHLMRIAESYGTIVNAEVLTPIANPSHKVYVPGKGRGLASEKKTQGETAVSIERNSNEGTQKG